VRVTVGDPREGVGVGEVEVAGPRQIPVTVHSAGGGVALGLPQQSESETQASL
jgi:acetyl esterase/lipase